MANAGRSPSDAVVSAADRLPLATFAVLFVGYASSYFHRSDLAVLGPLWRHDPEAAAMAQALPHIASLGLFVYALGKFIGGVLAERVGARRLFVLALAGACIAELGAASCVAPLPFGLWRLFGMSALAFAWPSLGQIVAASCPRHRLAVVMAFLSQSYLLGDAAVRALLAAAVRGGADSHELLRWAAVGVGGGALLSAIGLAVARRPRPLPTAVLAPAAAAANMPLPANATAAAPSMLAPMLWLAGMNAALAIVRESLGFWSPLVLADAGGRSVDAAVRASALLPLASCAGSLLAGACVDRGRWALLSVLVLPACAGAVPLLLLGSPLARGDAVLLLLAAASLLTALPSSLASGVLPLRAARGGGARWLGLVDGAGTLGAVLAGSGIGWLRAVFSMPFAFVLLAAAALIAATCAFGYLRALSRAGVHRS